VRLEGLGTLKKLHLIGTRTRYLPACSMRVQVCILVVCESSDQLDAPALSITETDFLLFTETHSRLESDNQRRETVEGLDRKADVQHPAKSMYTLSYLGLHMKLLKSC
jgi:hypothetical protein